ncbi:MAG: DUF721 domain-containing protein [Sphingobacteriales bacterium]|nr:MAG: DUF721 domain-containing protein [Sphingobacteriales bacterium]
MRPRKPNEQTLKEILKDFFTVYKLNTGLNEARIKTLWEEMMGKTIAKHTDKLVAKKGVLYLKISSAPLKQELFFRREIIIERINTRLGEPFLKEIVFT